MLLLEKFCRAAAAAAERCCCCCCCCCLASARACSCCSTAVGPGLCGGGAPVPSAALCCRRCCCCSSPGSSPGPPPIPAPYPPGPASAGCIAIWPCPWPQATLAPCSQPGAAILRPAIPRLLRHGLLHGLVAHVQAVGCLLPLLLGGRGAGRLPIRDLQGMVVRVHALQVLRQRMPLPVCRPQRARLCCGEQSCVVHCRCSKTTSTC